MYLCNYLTNCIEMGAEKAFYNYEGIKVEENIEYNVEKILIDVEILNKSSNIALDFIKNNSNDNQRAIEVFDKVACGLISLREDHNDNMTISMFIRMEFEDIHKQISSNSLIKKKRFKPTKNIKGEYKKYFPWYE